LFLSVEKLELPFFLVAESLKLILSCLLEFDPIGIDIEQTKRKEKYSLTSGAVQMAYGTVW